MRLRHDGVDHEVGRVGFDNVGSGRCTYYVGEIATEAGGSHGGEVGCASIAEEALA